MKNTMFVVVLCQLLFMVSCVSNINNAKININTIDYVKQSGILPLKNSNDDMVLYHIGSQVMEQSGFLSEYGQPYGYYAVEIKNSADKAPNFLFAHGLMV